MNYTILEPKMARFTDENIMVKDYHYYKGNEHDWNKPAMVSNKIYKFYKKNEEKKVPEIDRMKEQEFQDKAENEKLRQQWLLNRKAEDRIRLVERAKERSLVDLRNLNKLNAESTDQAYQTSLPTVEAQDIVAKKVNSSKHMRSKDNLWAYLHMADKKFVDTVIRPITIRGEEQAVSNIKSKIEKEKTELIAIQQKQTLFHQQQHSKIIKKHRENIEFGRKLGLFIPGTDISETPKINDRKGSRVDNNTLRSSNLIDSVIDSNPQTVNNVGKSEFKFNPQPVKVLQQFTDSSMPEVNVNQRSQSLSIKHPASSRSPESLHSRRNSNWKRLSLPKQVKKKCFPEFNPDSSDLKGLLIRQVDENGFMKGNYFHEKLANQSSVFNDILQDKKDKKTNRTLTKVRTSNLTHFSSEGEAAFDYSSLPVLSEKRRTPAEDMTFKTGLPEDKYREFNDEIATFEKNLSVMVDFGYSKSSLEEAKRSANREQKSGGIRESKLLK